MATAYTPELVAIAQRATKYVLGGGLTYGQAIEKARKEMPGGEKYTYAQVNEAVNDPGKGTAAGNDVGTPMGEIQLPPES